MRLVARKLLQLVVVVLLVSSFTFILITLLPGDPATTIIPFGSDEQRALFRADQHLNDPLPVQYGQWLSSFVRGDMGKYYRVSSIDEVWPRVRDSLPVSLQLMLYAQVITLVIAIPLGIATAYKAGSLFDRASNMGAFAAIALPNFALAFLLAYYLGVKRHWFPPTGYSHFGDGITDHFKSMFLPALSLAVGQVAAYMRLLRSDMIQTLQEDFILMAKSKGIPDRRVLWRHALRPSSLTLLTVAGLNVGNLIGGAIIIEVIFSLPGMGQLIGQAIFERQYVALQSGIAIVAIGYVLVNFVVDLLYSALDPRIRSARAAL